MADVQHIITLGIGSAPGAITWFVLSGLDTNPTNVVPLALTAATRGTALTADTRSAALTADTRSATFTLTARPQ